MLPKYRSRTFWSLLGLAVLFIILGLGNMFIGNNRTEVYSKLLAQSMAHQSPSALANPETVELTPSAQRIKGRLDFYRIVVIGGKCFLVFAGFLLLGCMALLQNPRSPSRKD